MLRKITKTIIAGTAAKFIYDSGYEAGKANRNSFFKELKQTTLKKIEDQLPPEKRAEFRNHINNCEHDIHEAKNKVRRGLGLPPK